MSSFISDDFILQTKAARDLYHRFAENQPIIDYHCHLNPELIANDHQFRDITEIWLEGDHYKWRAMRANGVPEGGRMADPDATARAIDAWRRELGDDKVLIKIVAQWPAGLNKPFI